MTCYQLMQEIEATVTFSLPDLQISGDQPATVHESTARYLESGPNGEIAFEYRPEAHLEGSLFMFKNSQYADEQIPVVATFYQAVLSGLTPVSEASLTGAENRERLFNASQAYYRRYMAQAISRNMRTVVNSSVSPVLTGTYYNPLNPRIFQNHPSKLALQIILGVMVLCGALAYFFSDMSHTLPHNPCSIAGTMSLLAGSEVCSRAETFSQMTDKEFKEDGWLFSLGWWPSKAGEPHRYGIDFESLGLTRNLIGLDR
jgi:hypothetical protein